jgi:hypothetical protein
MFPLQKQPGRCGFLLQIRKRVKFSWTSTPVSRRLDGAAGDREGGETADQKVCRDVPILHQECTPIWSGLGAFSFEDPFGWPRHGSKPKNRRIVDVIVPLFQPAALV